MTHLNGPRVSALLDGQLSALEADRAWAHVHLCHQCRDQVEREGWVKTRLSRLSTESGPVPDSLRGALLGMPPGDVAAFPTPAEPRRVRRSIGVAALGSGALGAAVLGVIALGAAPSDGPTRDHRPPPAQITGPAQLGSPAPSPVPTRGDR